LTARGLSRVAGGALVLAASALAAACGGSRGPKVRLRYRPPTGAAYRFALEQHSAFTVARGGGPPVPGPDMTMRVYYTQAVTGPTTGGIGATVTYDSTTVEPAAVAPTLERMRGLTSNVVYDERGRVVSARLAALGAAPSALADGIEKSVRGTAFPLPDTPVGVGDSWTSEEDQLGVKVGLPVKARMRFIVKAIQATEGDTTVLIGVERTFAGDPVTVTRVSRPGVPERDVVRVTGRITGERIFSLAKSAPLRSTLGGTIQIDVSGGPGGREVTTLSQQSTLQLTGAK
jgi:hypothetical protein